MQLCFTAGSVVQIFVKVFNAAMFYRSLVQLCFTAGSVVQLFVKVFNAAMFYRSLM